MALLNFGTAEGLAYRHDWGTVMQQQNVNEQLDNQAKVNAQNQAALYGNMFATKELSTRYDNQQAKIYTEGVFKQLGAFAMENPNWQTNAAQYSQMMSMKDGLLNNEWVRRSMNATTNYQALVKYIQENPGSENDPAVQQQMQQWKNYNDTGSIDGISANKKDFIFADPANAFDAQAEIQKSFTPLKAETTYDKKGVGIGATKSAVSTTALQSTALGLLNGPNGWRFQNTWKGMSPSEQAFYGNDPVNWIAKAGSAYTATEVKRGEVFKPTATGGGAGGRGGIGQMGMPYGAYYTDIGRMPAWTPTSVPNGDIFLPLQGGKMTVQGGINLQFTDKNGQPSWSQLTSYNGQQVDAMYNKVMMNDSNGNPHAQVTLKIPITSSSSELFTGANPILSDQSHWFEHWNPDENNDTQINDSWKGVAQFEKDKDGNNTGNLIVTGYVQAQPSTGSVRAYEAAAQGQSQANKEEGQSYGTLAAQDVLSHVVKTGTTADGRKIGQLDNGQLIDLKTLQPIQQ